MSYYIGYIFHNPAAIQNLKNIQKGLWIDWPTNDRMELREVAEGLILCTEADVYNSRQYKLSNGGPGSPITSIDVSTKQFQNRLKRDSKRLVDAIDKLNTEGDATTKLPSDPRDGVRLFIEGSP